MCVIFNDINKTRKPLQQMMHACIKIYCHYVQNDRALVIFGE